VTPMYMMALCVLVGRRFAPMHLRLQGSSRVEVQYNCKYTFVDTTAASKSLVELSIQYMCNNMASITTSCTIAQCANGQSTSRKFRYFPFL